MAHGLLEKTQKSPHKTCRSDLEVQQTSKLLNLCMKSIDVSIDQQHYDGEIKQDSCPPKIAPTRKASNRQTSLRINPRGLYRGENLVSDYNLLCTGKHSRVWRGIPFSWFGWINVEKRFMWPKASTNYCNLHSNTHAIL